MTKRRRWKHLQYCSLGGYAVANGGCKHAKEGSPVTQLADEYILYQPDVTWDHTHILRTRRKLRASR